MIRWVAALVVAVGGGNPSWPALEHTGIAGGTPAAVACYDPSVTRDDIRKFVNRDWARVAAAKTETWQAGERTPAGDLRAADQLRRYVLTVRPDWPGHDDRIDDLQSHIRVSEALGAIGIRPR